MPAQPRLFPVHTDIVLITLSREEAGWCLKIRQSPLGGHLLEEEPDLYPQCTLGEVCDIVGATLDGIVP